MVTSNYQSFLRSYVSTFLQFLVEVKPSNYYSIVSTSAVSLHDIKENILVQVMQTLHFSPNKSLKHAVTGTFTL